MFFTCKQPQMMTYERSESDRDNFVKFIHKWQPETKTLIRKIKRMLIKLYGQNVSLLFNQTCLNERLQPNHTNTHTHIYIYIYIYTHIHIYLFLKLSKICMHVRGHDHSSRHTEYTSVKRKRRWKNREREKQQQQRQKSVTDN